ncbi:hypothetical protein [Enterococcus phage EnP]|nr:hypothetical protein [Enterococcus phage vB_EfaS_Ef6.1]
MNYLTRDDIFNTARKGNRLTINPDSLDGIVYEEFDYEKGEPIYVAQFMVKSIRGQKMKSTFVDFEYSRNGLEQANNLVKRILG